MPAKPPLGLLVADDHYIERIWGGDHLKSLFNKPLPKDKPIGEAWLVSDHPIHTTVCNYTNGQSIRLSEAMNQNPIGLLGTVAKATPDGRFPLLLKLLDATDVLSMQVHPDDATARRLGEPDLGKTEMWYVLEARKGSRLYCGLDPSVNRTECTRSLANIEAMVKSFEASAGDTVFVPAGTVHAIGAGLVLAEIQQNSDITYRLHDWNRVDAKGSPRELHLEKSMEAIAFGRSHPGLNSPLSFNDAFGERTVLSACSKFAAERVPANTTIIRRTHGRSFQIVLSTSSPATVSTDVEVVTISPATAVIVPASLDRYQITSSASTLVYYVPDIELDIVDPLRLAGHSMVDIESLGVSI